MRRFILVLFHCTGNLRLEKKKNKIKWCAGWRPRQSSVCRWRWGGGVKCEEKMFDAVPRFPPKHADWRLHCCRPKIFSTLERRRTRSRTGSFPTYLCVWKGTFILSNRWCKVHPREGSSMDWGQGRLFLFYFIFFKSLQKKTGPSCRRVTLHILQLRPLFLLYGNSNQGGGGGGVLCVCKTMYSVTSVLL